MSQQKLLPAPFTSTVIFDEIDIGSEKLRLHAKIDQYAEAYERSKFEYENAIGALNQLSNNPYHYFKYRNWFF